jgi:hypothetical protein
MRYLYDAKGNEVTPRQVQERPVWYAKGRRAEDVFVERYGKLLDVQINPAKKLEPWQPDLLHGNDLADLKFQHTPFFMADQLGVEATYAVTFNLKDALEYGFWGRAWPLFSVYFWVHWVAVRMEQRGSVYKVQPLTGVWHMLLTDLAALCHEAPIWWYTERFQILEDNPEAAGKLVCFEPRLQAPNGVWHVRSANGNAACSYVLDVRKMRRVVPPEPFRLSWD